MSLLSKLFGKKPTPQHASEDYNGFRIKPQPISEGGSFRISAKIEKDLNGAVKTHEMIRADTTTSEDEAIASSVRKAKIFIDQMGDNLFD